MSEQFPANGKGQDDKSAEDVEKDKKDEVSPVRWREYKESNLSRQDEEILKKILAEEKEKFIPHEQYSCDTSPKFWRTVFIRFYGTEPDNDKDPRWDSLLASGRPIFFAAEKTENKSE